MSPLAWIAIGLLGGVAAGARFLVDSAITAGARTPFPLGILAVNLSGALALGVLAGVALDGEALAIVGGGGVGSFTTFSTWILDSERLGEAGLGRLAALNLAGSVLAGFAAVALGHWLGGLL